MIQALSIGYVVRGKGVVPYFGSVPLMQGCGVYRWIKMSEILRLINFFLLNLHVGQFVSASGGWLHLSQILPSTLCPIF